jgi:hypothetical protein
MKKTGKSKQRLSAIRNWSVRIVKPKTVSEKVTRAPETTDTALETSDTKNDTNRRLQDTVHSNNLKRKLNLDRRAVKSERRVSSNHNYNGPVRRYTIDRRINLNDRRSKS